jgi:hypothetical protein
MMRKMAERMSVLGLVACVGLAIPVVAQDVKPSQPKPAAPATQPKPAAPATQPKPTTGAPVVKPVAPPTPPIAKPGVDAHDHAAGGVQPSDPAQSPLSWDGMAHDFGNIPDTAMVTHIFRFTNRTDKRVTIQSAAGSCGCTVPALEKKAFEPGESGEMTVTFNPQHRRGPQPKQITVMYAEPAGTPSTVLTINSNVQPLMVVEPMKMYLMEVDAKQGKSTEITVSGRKADFQVLGVDTTNPNLSISVGEKRAVTIDGEQFQQYPVSVMVKPNAPLGEFQTELAIRTNEPTAASTNYIFVADVVGELKATPNKLTLRAYTPNIPFANVVTLESRSGRSFKVTSVEVEGRDDMQLVADVEPNNMTGKPAYTVRLNGVTPDVTGMVSGEIIVKTDLPDNPEIRLPFSTSIRGSAAPAQQFPSTH